MSNELEELIMLCMEQNATLVRFLRDRQTAVIESEKGCIVCLRYIENEWI